MLRRLIPAVVLLVPALVNGASYVFEGRTKSAHISFKLPSRSGHELETDELTLHLEVDEFEKPCSHASVKINGQSLPESVSTTNHATFGSDEDSFVASWNMTCLDSHDDVPSEMLAIFSVDMLSGQVLEDVVFAARFQQTAPARILEIDGPVRVTINGPSEDDYDGDDESEEDEESPEEDDKDDKDDELRREALMYAALAELEHLRDQLHDLEQLILLKEKSIAKEFGVAADSSRHCSTMKCVLKSFVDKIATTAGKAYNGIIGEDGLFDHWHHPSGDSPQISKDPPAGGPEDVLAAPTSGTTSESPSVPDEKQTSPHAAGLSMSNPSRKDAPQSTLLRISLISLLVFSMITALVRYCCRLSFYERLKLRAARRVAARRRREERRANRRRRWAVFKTTVANMSIEIGGRISHLFFRRALTDEEKEAMLAEQRQRHYQQLAVQSEPAAQGSPRRRIVDVEARPRVESESEPESELSTTMEEEIARFREVAGVVDSMVSAEEGRLRRLALEREIQEREREREREREQARARNWERQPVGGGGRPRSERTWADPPRPPSAFGDGYSSDDSLPPYESEDESRSASFLVADGFRYRTDSPAYTPSTGTSAGSRYTPSGSSQAGSGVDDVLGPTKNYD